MIFKVNWRIMDILSLKLRTRIVFTFSVHVHTDGTFKERINMRKAQYRTIFIITSISDEIIKYLTYYLRILEG